MQTLTQLLERKGRHVVGIGPDQPVLEAVRSMADRHVGALMVLDGNGRVVGIVSERDYARKVVLQGRSSADTPVSAIMTAQVVHIAPDATVNDAMRVMTDRRIRHLPVMSGDRLLGIVSIGDLVKAVIEDQKAEIDSLQAYIRG
ncbi:MAG: CBS domain-containing protein [Steroidobacteraceae bacterium]